MKDSREPVYIYQVVGQEGILYYESTEEILVKMRRLELERQTGLKFKIKKIMLRGEDGERLIRAVQDDET